MENSGKYTKVTNVSWFTRIKDSIQGILIGLALFFGAFVVLWWNEGRAVATAKGIKEVAENVVSISSLEVNEDNEGKLVHVSGTTSTEDVLVDELFKVQENAIKLRRVVSMYQWVENTESSSEKKLGGSEDVTTTYTYRKEWRENVVNSTDFEQPGYDNPSAFAIPAMSKSARNVKMNAFDLSSNLIGSINDFQPLSVENAVLDQVSNAKVIDGAVYVGEDYLNPQIGDLKITFEVVKPGVVTVLAKQHQNSFEPYQTKSGRNYEMLVAGNVSSDQLVQNMESSNNLVTWLLRLVGFLMIFFGISLVLKPAVVLADIIPFIGSILNAGVSLVAGIAAFSLSFVTIALGWIYYRPVLGISLLLIGGVAFFFGYKKIKEKKLEKEAKAQSVAA
jgi:hypothetical protein